MKTANDIAEVFNNKYSDVISNLVVQRDKRLWLEVSLEFFRSFFEKVIKLEGFSILCTITGMDLQDKYQVIYHMSNNDGVMLNIKTALDKKEPVVPTIIDLFPAAELSERELEDLLGIKVSGLPEGRRYPLSDDWPKDQYPLRKDWNETQPDNKIEKVSHGGKKDE